MAYNWQLDDWGKFSYSIEEVEDLLFEFTEKIGRQKGLLEGLPTSEQEETLVQFLVDEAINTSEIENEYLNRKDVLSTVKHHLGFKIPLDNIRDLRAKGIGELLVKLRQNYQEPLSENTLKYWHKLLFTGTKHIAIGEWRSGDAPMQVISGRADKPKVHFEAPPSHRIPDEIKNF